MDAARVVEVWSPAVGRVGSGYLLSEGLVLTSYHVVPGLEHGATVDVRPLSDREEARWLPALLCWPEQPVDLDAHPERDAALLVIDERHRGAGTARGRVRFGLVTGQDRTPCVGLGFPDAEARPDGRRDTMPVRGHLDALQARKSGLLTVHVDEGIVPRRRAQGSGWAGSSGTALFCGPLLVGVLATDRAIADDASVLGAAPLTVLEALPGFRETLAAHGVELRLEPATKTHQRLTSYLAAARNAAVEHPYDGVLPGSAPLLNAVYLRQHVHRREGEPAQGRHVGPRPARTTLIGIGTHKRTYSLEAEPSEGRQEARRGSKTWTAVDALMTAPQTSVILAGPGGGKSSLLRTLLAAGIERWDAGHDVTPLPVLVHASALADSGLTKGLATAASTHLRAHGLVEDLSQDFFLTAPKPGARWLVLVDGLDEVTDPAKRRSVLRLVASRSDTHDSPYVFIIATRPLAEEELALLGDTVPRYDLLAFDRTDLPEVFTRWFRAHNLVDPEQRARLFRQQLDRSNLLELARVPLMTAMLCQLHATSSDDSLPSSRGEIYRRFTTMLRQHQYRTSVPGTHRHAGVESYPEGVRHAENTLKHLPDLIGYLAAQRHAGCTLPAVTIVQSQTEAACPKGIPSDVWQRFLDTALCRSGLLVPRGADLEFLHPTFLEYLSACHVTSMTGVDALRVVFDRPRRRLPFRKESGAQARLWLRRYWMPPQADPSDVGFLLDAAQEQDRLTAGTVHLGRLVAGGLRGCEYLGALVQLGTALPADVLRQASAALRGMASDPATDAYSWGRAVDALARLGDRDTLLTLLLDPTVSTGTRARTGAALAALGDRRAGDGLHALLTDADVDADVGIGRQVRLQVGQALSKLGDPRGVDILHGLAQDNADVSWFNRTSVEAADALARLGDVRAADLYAALAERTTDQDLRLRGAKALAGLGDPRGTAMLYDLAMDGELRSRGRLDAARALAGLGDPRVPDLLHAAALDPGCSGEGRLTAAETLAGLGDPRGGGVLYAIALDPSIRASPTWGGLNPDPRAGAAKALAELGDPRGIALLHDLAEDMALGHWSHLEAASALARLGDPRASELLHAAALDSSSSGENRLRAAEALTGLDDPRGADALYAIALDPSVQPWKRDMTGYGRPPTPRVSAAEALAGLGDPRALNLLRGLTHARGTFDWYDRELAREALKRLRTRPDDILTWMGTLMHLGQSRAKSRKRTM
ncbi:hypothetical protein [Streptomyces sp. YS415]|uniref:hypothetical protein n=1 Tax=Streptomyces sp. YS415 TaxID=2944806 RepID=UPI0020224A98|nr:hypothetical protein [Streptomyces sp. YS415]MCL7430264.1 hypothetical protein [Streptomyces sp. YS415]